MRARFISALSAATALSAFAPAASAVDTKVNQIYGTVSFSNTLLTLPAITSGSVSTSSVSPIAGLSGGIAGTVATSSSLTYKISVNANDFIHFVWSDAYMGSDHWYHFAGAASAPVPNEPAPDTLLNLSECAGLVHVRWLDALTLTPVVVANPSSVAFYQGSAQASVSGSTADHLDFSVRGDGSTIHFGTSYTTTTGSDPFTDLVTIPHDQPFDMTVNCDQEITLDVLVPSGSSGGGGTGGSPPFGEITGYFNLLGESELTTTSVMHADDGPFGNYRYSLVPGNPAEGPYDLLNLLPSNTVSPPKSWRVWGDTTFNNALGVQEFFRTEGVYTPVTPGPATSLGNTFVMNDQTISGGIVLEGLSACQQAWASNYPNTNMYAASVNGVAFAQAPITGAFLPSNYLPGTQGFAGTHLLAFGTPNNGNAAWNSYFNLLFRSTANPNSATSVQLHNDLVAAIPSGTVPIQACFGEFRMALNVNNLGEETRFHSPSASINGGFNGKDFSSSTVKYSVFASASGLPDSSGTPVNSTSMPLCLPVGDYTVHPGVVAVSATGENSTALADVANLTIGCGAIVNTDIVTVANTACGTATSVPFAITWRDVYSKVDVVQAIAHITPGTGGVPFDIPICGGAAPHVCASGAGTVSAPISDAFVIQGSQLAQLTACGDSVVVEVIDAVGNSSKSGSLAFGYDPAPIPACGNITVPHAASTGGAFVNLNAALATITTCGHQPTFTNLLPANNSFFPIGTTPAAGNFVLSCAPLKKRACSFTVTVQ